jgi:hypothetical protein
MPHTINEFKGDIKPFIKGGVNHYIVVTRKCHVAKSQRESQQLFALWMENMNG